MSPNDWSSLLEIISDGDCDKQPFIDSIDMLNILGHLYNMDGHNIEREDIICKYSHRFFKDMVDNKKLI